jgi:hypothetical protein
MRQLLALVAKRIGVQYTDVVDWLRTQNSVDEIAERIARGDYANAIAKVDDAALKIAADIEASYVTSAQTMAEWLDSKVPGRLVRFDTADRRVVARARANQLDRVYGFQEERWQIARQITQRALVEGAQSGANPRRVAQDFRDSIGLAPSQEEWVANYRRYLEQGDYLRATRYELSSGQADRTLRRMARSKETLSQAQIDDFTERFRQNAITMRAQTIARTEALEHAHAGVADALSQAIANGDVDADDLEKEWHARGYKRGRSREDHRAMDEVRVKLGEDFVLPDGTRMSRPGDRRGGAKHCANCGCTISTTFAALHA